MLGYRWEWLLKELMHVVKLRGTELSVCLLLSWWENSRREYGKRGCVWRQTREQLVDVAWIEACRRQRMHLNPAIKASVILSTNSFEPAFRSLCINSSLGIISVVYIILGLFKKKLGNRLSTLFWSGVGKVYYQVDQALWIFMSTIFSLIPMNVADLVALNAIM